MPTTEEILQAARALLAGGFQGVLATQSLACPGYPFGSLVPYCLDGQGRPLLLLSHLAQHTRNLEQDQRVSLTVTQRGDGDTQELRRLTCTADAEAVQPLSTEIAERYFRYFPQTREYFALLGFRFVPLRPQRFHFVGGFGAARWISPERLDADNPFAQEFEAGMLREANDRFTGEPDLAAALARRVGLAPSAPLLVAGLDPAGADLRQNARLRRLDFDTAVQDPQEALQSLLLASAPPQAS